MVVRCSYVLTAFRSPPSAKHASAAHDLRDAVVVEVALLPPGQVEGLELPAAAHVGRLHPGRTVGQVECPEVAAAGRKAREGDVRREVEQRERVLRTVQLHEGAQPVGTERGQPVRRTVEPLEVGQHADIEPRQAIPAAIERAQVPNSATSSSDAMPRCEQSSERTRCAS